MTHLRIIILLSLLLGLSACLPPLRDKPSNQPAPTQTTIPSTPTAATPPPFTSIPTPTPLNCLTQPGRVDSGAINVTNPPQEFLIYLPPCYEARTDQHYPVLYLLHGQLSIDDQWVRLGATVTADNLILSGKSKPFIIVLPDDRYWNLPPEAGFGDRVINNVIPYIDGHYRTLTDRSHRAVGGLSLGGGWAIHIGLTRYDLFGAIGLHSPAIRPDDAPYLEDWIKAIPPDLFPRIWIDAGDQDRDLGSITQFENLLSDYLAPHEWHLYNGDHSEAYWQAHIAEYIQWYADGWENNP